MRSAETIFLLALAGFLTGISALGVFYYDYPASLLRFPMLAAGSTLIVVVVQLAALWRGTAPVPLASPSAAPKPEASMRENRIRQGLILLPVLPLVFLLGFPTGLAAYLLIVLRHAGESWRLSLMVAAGSLVLSYGVFVAAMGVPLPLLPSWWPS